MTSVIHRANVLGHHSHVTRCIPHIPYFHSFPSHLLAEATLNCLFSYSQRTPQPSGTNAARSTKLQGWMPSPPDSFQTLDERLASSPPAEHEGENPLRSELRLSKKKKKKLQKHATVAATRQNELGDREVWLDDEISTTTSPTTGQNVAQGTTILPQESSFVEETVALSDAETHLHISPLTSSTFPSTQVVPPQSISTSTAAGTGSPPTRTVNLQDRRRSPASSKPAFLTSQTHRESIGLTRQRFVEPPPPHMPQAHFFSLPDLGLISKSETNSPAGSDGYVCCLGSFADAGDDASARKARDTLLVGSEGGLEVYRVMPNKLEVVGRLEGLRGAVVGAQIIPFTGKYDGLRASRPLIALIIHGPMMNEAEVKREVEPIGYYQTTAEIYSLQTQRHVTTIFRCLPVPVERPIVGQWSSLPKPTGCLSLFAEGRYVAIASGESGETWVFTHSSDEAFEGAEYRCIGKFWTSLQDLTPVTSTRSASVSDNSGDSMEPREQKRRPLISLSERWLVVTPPLSPHTISIQATPLLSDNFPIPPGMATHAAPPQPLVNCEAVCTDTEGTWTRLGRQAAQGFVKYSQKGIEMGLQGWKELTSPSQPTGPTMHDRTPQREESFPPTKGPSEDPSRFAKEPSLVSIIDLETLTHSDEQKSKYPTLPMATFALADGCSFLSLSATGTRLLTASRRGEISTVWDLMHVAHGVSRRASSTAEDIHWGPRVTQVQHITRNSSSIIVDCAWTRDDDALALLTAHGTVHLHENPIYVSRMKSKRKAAAVSTVPEKANATIGISTGLSPPSSNHGFIGTIRSSWQTVSTQVNSIRTTNPASALGLPTTFAGFREATASAGNAGSRAVARGISQGYTVAKGGASDYWHAEENKIRHKALQDSASFKSLRWIQRQNASSLAIVCGGTVHVHPVQRVMRYKGDESISGLRHEKYSHKAFALPPITTRSETGSKNAEICTGEGPHGFWSLQHSAPAPVDNRHKNAQSLKQEANGQANDVETNPPFCPFHVDARVDIFAFDEFTNSSHHNMGNMVLHKFCERGHGLVNEEPWTFGSTLPPSTKMNEHDVHDLDVSSDYDGEADDYHPSQAESTLLVKSAPSGNGETLIRINTRRKSRQAYNQDLQSSVKRDGEFESLDDSDGVI